MQIISLNMHDTKMSQEEMNSTGKITLGSTDKSLVVTIITLFWVLPCLKVSNVKCHMARRIRNASPTNRPMAQNNTNDIM